MKEIALATEDIVSEAVGVRLLSEYKNLTINPFLRRDGFGYLKSNAPKWRAYAQRHPVLLITDLDSTVDADKMKEKWFGKPALPDQLLFCVAVREIEAWLLADHKGLRGILGKNAKIPPTPDDIDDPKSYLLNIARGAPRHIRNDLVKENGAVASQGIGYNVVMRQFVREKWDITAASERSPSLLKTVEKLSELFGE